MGGSNKKKTASETTQTPVATQPAMATFGGTMNPSILAQLQQGGLLDAVQPTGYYAPVSVPIIRTPGDVTAYLQSIGQHPATVDAASSSSSKIPSSMGMAVSRTGNGSSTPSKASTLTGVSVSKR